MNAVVDDVRRQQISLNHSATHLLHAALRQVLGEHVAQKGSLVSDALLRFDFAHHEAISKEQLAEVERIVNQQVRANNPRCSKSKRRDGIIRREIFRAGACFNNG